MSTRVITPITELFALLGFPPVASARTYVTDSTHSSHFSKGCVQANDTVPRGVIRRPSRPMVLARSALLCALSFVLASLTTMPTAEAQTAQDTDAEARGLFLAGQAAFASSRYDDALRYFRQSYELSGRPQLLYNIAVAADRLRRDEEALAAFEQFLRDAPADAPQRHDVEARLPVLREAVARARETTLPTNAPDTIEDSQTTDTTIARDDADASSDPAPTATRHRSVGPWVLTGASAAVAVGGVLSFALGRRDAARVTDASDGASWASVEGAASRAGPEMNIGLALLGVGAVGAAAGITWTIVGKNGDEPAASAELRVVPGGLIIAGEF